MSNTLTLTSPAKLNLFLHITGRRKDGYHNLQTLFQMLDYGDTMTFSPGQDRNIELTPVMPGIPHEDNLIVRAAKLLQATTHTNQGASIHITKNLPMGGGIGGGSSNAATTLLALNQLWGTQLNLDELAQLGRKLGADVPVFIKGDTAFAEGIGEKLTPIELPSRWYLVLAPNCHVSTADIFCHKDLTRDTPIIKVAAILEQGRKNDCQPLVRTLFPEVNEALNWLSQYGDAQMTGTGACVFAAFDSEAEANDVLKQLPDHLNGFVASGNNRSICHRELFGK